MFDSAADERRLVAADLRYRAREWVVWMGVPSVGLIAAYSPAIPYTVCLYALLGAGLIVANMLFLNDWAGLVRNPSEAARLGVGPDAAARHAGALRRVAVVVLVMGCCFLVLVSWRCLVLGAVFAMLGFLYSHPTIRGKERPWAAEAIHVLGGAVLYGLGASAGGGPHLDDVAPALFFGLVLVAGHLSHQAIGAEEDARGGLRTLATHWRGDVLVRSSFVLFLSAHSGLVAAWLVGWATPALALAFSLPLCGHVAFAMVARKWIRVRGPAEVARAYRRLYRSAFAAGLVGFVLGRCVLG